MLLLWAVREKEHFEWFAQEILETWSNGGGEQVEFEAKLFVTGRSDATVDATVDGVGVKVGVSDEDDVDVEMITNPQRKEGKKRTAIAVGAPMPPQEAASAGPRTTNTINTIITACGTAHQGRPDIAAELTLVQQQFSTSKHIDVFVCGPGGMRNAVLHAASLPLCSAFGCGAGSVLPPLFVHDETFEL